MRTLLGKVIPALAITTMVTFGADNSLGTWKLNLEKSTYSPGPIPVKSLTTTREAVDRRVKVTTTGERTDGTAISTSYTTNYDGTASSVPGTGAPYDTITVKRVNANKFTDDRKKMNGSYHATGRTAISNGGKTMMWTSKGTDSDDKEFTATFVFDKQ
jgi:hypothetical protein